MGGEAEKRRKSLTQKGTDVPKCCPPYEGTDLANNAYNCHIRWAHENLVLQEGWEQILTAVAATVESSHQNDQVDEKHPVLLDGDPRLSSPGLEAGSFDVVLATLLFFGKELGFTLGTHHLEVVGFWETPAKGYDQDRWTSAKPEQ